jgi:glucokinase-like ROK family protein
MRLVNRSAVLDLIRRCSPLSRSEIGRRLGLSLPTVMRIVEGLVEEDLVRYTVESEPGRGHRRRLLRYNPDNSLVIGIDLGGTKIFGALANIGGQILEEHYLEWHGVSAEHKFETVVDLVQRFLDLPQASEARVRGLAVGAPGVTDHRHGIVRWAPALDWRDFPLQQRLQARFELPVLVENDVNLAALGEHTFGIGRGCRDMILITLGTGMGAGLIVDGVLYRGAHDSAGEVGYLLPSVEALGMRYDHFGAMESIVSGTGIAERAHQRLGPRAAEHALSARHVFEAARQGEDWAQQVVDETIDYLTLAIANISSVLDPELVILGGGVANSAQALIPPICERMQGLIPYPPRIEASDLGYRATVMGAIALTVLATTGYTGKM